MKEIDYSKCIGCLKCTGVCPTNYIEASEADERQTPKIKDRGRCLNCRHCEAICPVGAVTDSAIEKTDSADDELLNLFNRKRTHRKYIKGSEITKEQMELLNMSAQSAPTDRNRKTVRLIYVKELLPEAYNSALDFLVERVQKAGQIDPLYVPTMSLDSKRDEILWDAEYLVLGVGSKQYQADAVIMAERIQLMAERLGLGTGYRGDMKEAINSVDELRKLLSIKSNEEVLISFALGVPEDVYVRPGNKELHKIIFM